MNDYARKKFREVYKPFLIEGAKFDWNFDIPICPCTAKEIPSRLIYYNEIVKSKQKYSGFVHFYMDDYKFESIWNHPQVALKKLRRCDGIITPDFSTYLDMPVALKIYNTYRMRAIGYWLGKQGLQVINNVRWSYENSYKYCFDGIEKNSTVCISSVGCLCDKHDEDRFIEGLKAMVQILNPSHILFYGMKGRNFMSEYIASGIPVTFYNPPDTHKIITKTVTKIDLLEDE